MGRSIRRLESVRRLQEIRQESTGPVSFSQKLLSCLVGGGTCCLIFILLLVGLAGLGLSIAKIVIGSLYQDDCPAQSFIPIYLIVAGCVSIIFNCSCRPSKNEEGGYKLSCEGASAILGLLVAAFTLIWLIVGTVYVVQTNQQIQACTDAAAMVTPLPSGNMTDGCPQCNELLLSFSLGTIIFEWCFFGIIILLLCCCCCIPMCLGKSDARNPV